MEDKLLMTYALLSHLKETHKSDSGSLIKIFEPIVEKAIIEYAKEKGTSTVMGKSITEIQVKIKEFFGIEIPVGVLTIILNQISKEINDENIFVFHKYGSFIIKAFVFSELDEDIRIEQSNIEELQADYKNYCSLYNYEYNFKELRDFILALKIDLFTDKNSDVLDVNFSIPKYIKLKLNDNKIFKIISDIYLGSLLSSYLEMRINTPVTKTELLLDTNFFISLIDFNTEEAFLTCTQLFNLCKTMGFRCSILYSTVAQIKILLNSRIQDFANKELGFIKESDIFGACLRKNIDKTQLERIKDNIDTTIRNMNIEVIAEPRIIKIIDEAKKSKMYQELRVIRGNNTSALNDTVAHFYVKKNRGSGVTEFSDVKCWFLHNSFHPGYESNLGYKIHERNAISANELLTLLWLTNPNQKNVNSDIITKGGLATYVAKYRCVKMPSLEVIKMIKEKANIALKHGKIQEKDIYSISIRMSEGHFSNGAVEELSKMPEDNFANIIKEYAQQDKEIMERLNAQTDGIKDLNSRMTSVAQDNEQLRKDNQFFKYNLALKEYEKKRDEQITQDLNKTSRTMINTAWAYLVFVLIVSGLWVVDKIFSKLINPIVSFGIAFVVMICSLVLIKFVEHKTVLQCLKYTFQRRFRKKIDTEVMNQLIDKYETINPKPKLEDF